MRNESAIVMDGFTAGWEWAMTQQIKMIASILDEMRRSSARALVYAAGTTMARGQA